MPESSRRRHIVAVVIVLCGLLSAVSGCSVDSGDPGTVQTPPSTMESATPSAEPGWTIRRDAIGPFSVGMRYADALTAHGAHVSEECTGVAAVQQAHVRQTDEQPSMWVIASERDPQGTVGTIIVSGEETEGGGDGARPTTARGIGIGTDSDTLEDAYPDARISPDEASDTTVYFLTAPGGGGLAFVVAEASETVVEIVLSTGPVPPQGDPCDTGQSEEPDDPGSE